jgi:acetamidase/formamidase
VPPTLTIQSGDTVVFDTRDSSDGHYHPGSTAADAAAFAARFKGMPLTGPVFVAGARPGDVLQVDVVAVEPGPFAWTATLPGYGLLQDEFSTPYVRTWDLSDGTFARLSERIRVPIEPFCGVMGVAPAEPGQHSTVPPRRTGGNMDIKHLVAGSVLYLPIEVEGALFSAGDAHAAQGDGEVCVSALEMSARATLRFRVRSDLRLAEPQFQTPGLRAPGSGGPAYVTTGRSPDLMEAAKQSVRYMIEHLSSSYGLSPQDAYVLASVAVDLKISQVVDAPNWIVSAFLPLALFDGAASADLS